MIFAEFIPKIYKVRIDIPMGVEDFSRMVSAPISDSECQRRHKERPRAKKLFAGLQMTDSSQGLQCTVVDMHEEGVGLLVHRPLEVDTSVLIAIAADAFFALNLKSEVRHVRKISKGLWHIGVEFDRSHPRYHKKIAVLQSLENVSRELQPFQKPAGSDSARI